MPTAVGIAVVTHNGCVLVGKRSSGTPLAGFSEFPGGKFQEGETAEQCAARECLEETGIEIAAERQLSLVDYEYDHGPIRLTFVLCRPLDPELPPRPPFCWVPIGELSQLTFPPANNGVLRWLVSASKAWPAGLSRPCQR